MNPIIRSLRTLALVTLLAACGDPHEFPDLSTSQQPIIDGRLSAGADFPSTGAMIMEMHLEGEVSGTTICSGTLIAPDVVLTAAHCTPGDAMFAEELEGFDARFYFTFHTDLTAFDGENPSPPPQTTAVAHWVNNPGYVGSPENIDDTLSRESEDGLGKDGDIALLFLAEPVRAVTPTPILRPDQAPALAPGRSVQVAGYGQQHRAADAEDPAVKYHGESHLHEVGEYELQVGDRAGASSPAPRAGLATKCYGDSGGPTYLHVNGQQYVIGVTSRGYDDAPDCDRAGIDTRVDAYAGWIDQVMTAGCRDNRRSARVCGGDVRPEGPSSVERPAPTSAEPRPVSESNGEGEADTGGCDLQGGATDDGWIGLVFMGAFGLGRRRRDHSAPRRHP